MSGYQFIHSTALNSAKASQTIAEAERKPHACPHVTHPQPPKVIYGTTPGVVLAEAREWAKDAEHPSGRKWRRDAPILAAGVASLPASMADRFDDFAKQTVEWLRERYGERLRSVVTHKDEANPHLHFFLRPQPQDLSFGSCHEGYRESREARRQEGNKIRTAYQSAMKAFQDDFHSSVASRFGLARLGPKRQRLSRAEWRAQQNLAASAATQKATEQDRLTVQGELRELRKERRELERLRESLTAEQKQRIAELQNAEAELKAARSETDADRERLRAALKALPAAQLPAALAKVKEILDPPPPAPPVVQAGHHRAVKPR